MVLQYWPTVNRFEVLCGNVVDSTYYYIKNWIYGVILDLLVDINGHSYTCEVHNFGNGIQVHLTLIDLLSFLHLLAKEKKSKRIDIRL